MRASCSKFFVAYQQIVGGSGDRSRVPVRLAAAFHTIPTLSTLILSSAGMLRTITFHLKNICHRVT